MCRGLLIETYCLGAMVVIPKRDPSTLCGWYSLRYGKQVNSQRIQTRNPKITDIILKTMRRSIHSWPFRASSMLGSRTHQVLDLLCFKASGAPSDSHSAVHEARNWTLSIEDLVTGSIRMLSGRLKSSSRFVLEREIRIGCRVIGETGLDCSVMPVTR
jgi:hypothetical protein